MTFAAIFAILVGLLMIVQWTTSILKKQVAGPEAGLMNRGRNEMAHHWAAEFATAILLIILGASLLFQMAWGLSVFFVAIGMLIYTVINSPGYFAQQRKWSMVIMFVAINISPVVSTAHSFRK
jgi:hypothetical protein